VLGRDGGVIFIPRNSPKRWCKESEHTRLHDIFGTSGFGSRNTPPARSIGEWTPEIEADFTQWMKDNIDKLPVDRAAVQEFIAARALFK